MTRSIDYIDKLIEEYGLVRIKDYIHKNLKKSIRLSINQKDDSKSTGSSRAGGYPDVPADFTWPLTEEGELMTFIAQLNMEEISQSDEEGLLPKKGMLYFFIGLDEPAYDIEHKVIFIEEAENLRLLKPNNPTVLDEVYGKFNAYKLIGTKCLEIPNYAYMDYDTLDEDEVYFALQEDLKNKDNNYIGCMFGYPEGQHNDSELEAALKIIANDPYTYSSEDKNKLIAFFNGDAKKAEDEINNIQMLLELTSDFSVGFSWWDSGDIHFFIRKEDLISKRFDRTYLSLYSS